VRPLVPTRDAVKIRNKRLRENGWSDGYARRAPRSVETLYRRSYQLGKQARAGVEQ
jgi:hypothetical protein